MLASLRRTILSAASHYPWACTMLQREFTGEQIMFRDAYREFPAAEIVPHMEAWREAKIRRP